MALLPILEVPDPRLRTKAVPVDPARLADPAHKIAPRVEKAAFGEAETSRLEGWIDALEETLPPLRHFILAGGSPAGVEVACGLM